MLRNLLFMAFAGVLLLSCGKSEAKSETVASLEKVALSIEGMTCEIGCARTIQSKLSKTEGVITANVSFDEKQGIVSMMLIRPMQKKLQQ